MQVTLTLPTKVDLLETAGLQSPPERTVHWRFFYAKGQRHAVEAMQGNRCALCQMMCLSFTVCAPLGPTAPNIDAAKRSAVHNVCARSKSDAGFYQHECGLQGLKLHLEACHARFVYGFCEDHPDVPPAIHVACAEELQVVQQQTEQASLQSTIVQVSVSRMSWQSAQKPASKMSMDLLQYISFNQGQHADRQDKTSSLPNPTTASLSPRACVQSFFRWVPWSQRNRRVAMYQARTGKALGLKDRHLLAHQSVLVEQRSTDRPSSTVSSAARSAR